MTQIETPAGIEAREFFESFGYEVSPIKPVGRCKCADYRVFNRTERYVVEVKQRIADAAFALQIEESSWAESEDPVARTNVISRQVREAANQLDASDRDDMVAIRLIAFVVAEDDSEIQFEQFQRTVFGTVDLLSEDASGTVAVPCFYFTFSDFFRFRNVDAAIILSPQGARLCANSFGKKKMELREMFLYRKLLAAGAVIDPSILESANEAFVADTDIDRRDEAAVLAYVRAKYNRPELLTFKPKRIRVAKKVPRVPPC